VNLDELEHRAKTAIDCHAPSIRMEPATVLALVAVARATDEYVSDDDWRIGPERMRDAIAALREVCKP
jgi:hypothetical protein